MPHETLRSIALQEDSDRDVNREPQKPEEESMCMKNWNERVSMHYSS
jgi:hypothetical protein